MSRSRCLTVFVLAAAGGLVRGQDAPVVFRSDVSLVRLDAQVVDRDNRAITGLRAEDFVLRDNGKVQEIRNFAREDLPVDILLLLDVSRSMRPHVERVASAAQEALRALGENDRVAVMVFDRSSRLRMPFRGDRARIQRGLDDVLRQEDFGGGTDITRGLMDAAAYVTREGRREARRAIVILTDDQTEFNRDESRVIRAMSNGGIVVSALLAPDAMGYGRSGGTHRGGGSTWPNGPLGGIILGRRPPYGGNGPVAIGSRTKSAGTAEIARATGGDDMRVDDASALETTLARIRQRYALHFNLAEAERTTRDEVDLDLSSSARRRYPDAEVRFRRVSISGETGSAGTSRRGSSPDSDDPVVISSSDSAEDRPKFKRRRGVSEGSAGARVETAPESGSVRPAAQATTESKSKGGWRRADEADAADRQDPTGAEAPTPSGGWRKVKPGEKP